MREWLIRQFGKARLMRWIMTFYPPYFGAGVRVKHISDDFRDIQVSMGLGWYNRNYVGTQFGGSLYSMVDPFFMLMLMENLGSRYIVWDKAADIDFISPAKARCSPGSTSTTPCSTRSVGRPPVARNTCRSCRSTFMTAPATSWRGSVKPFTCGSSRQRDRLKAWKCARMC